MRLIRLPECEGCERVVNFANRHHLEILVEIASGQSKFRRFPVLITDDGNSLEGFNAIMRYLGHLAGERQ